MATRKAVGKRLRFSVFARDGFTCRYCGRQSDTVELHIDHVVPVVQGGTNDETNLITACADCNLGKSARLPTFTHPTEADRLRAAQDFHEQQSAGERARAAMEAAQRLDQDLVNLWCDAFGDTALDRRVIPNLRALMLDHGPEEFAAILAIAAGGCYSTSDTTRIRYVYGVRRNRHPEFDVRYLDQPET